MEHNFHQTDDQLEQYALNRLPEADLPRLEEHLLTCVACQEKLDEIGDFALGMREALTTTTPIPARIGLHGFGGQPCPWPSTFAALIIRRRDLFPEHGRTKFAPVPCRFS